MNVIVNTTSIKVSPENRRELFQTIWPLLDPIRREKGCLAYSCYVDLADENNTVLIGEWETRAALDDHLRSRDCAILIGAINVLAGTTAVDFKLLSRIERAETVPTAKMSIESKED